MKRFFNALVVATGILSAGLAVSEPRTNVRFINVLTGGTSGVYYPLGVGLSQIYRQAMPDARVSVQATKASAENLNMLQAGRAEVAFTLGDTLSDAWRGDERSGFRVPLKRLRVIAAMYPNYVQIVARADAGIKTLADLKGKRVSVGLLKSGTELNARSVFEAAGLRNNDFARVEYLAFADSVELMKRRQLDATLQSAGLGVASLRDLAKSVKIVVVPIEADVVAKVGDAAYQPGIIPAKTYAGQTTDVPTASIRNFLVTHEDMPDDVVYQMTRAMFENLDRLAKAHSAARKIDLAVAAKNLSVPLHPGAARYYREAGLIQ